LPDENIYELVSTANSNNRKTDSRFILSIYFTNRYNCLQKCDYYDTTVACNSCK